MLSPRKHVFFVFVVMATDAISIASSLLIAYWIRFSGILMPAHKGIAPFHVYWRTLFVVLPIFLLIFRAYRLYQPERHVRRIYELLNVVKAVTVSILALMALSFVYREFSYSRAVLVMSWVLCTFFCCSGRYITIQIEYFWMRKKHKHQVLIVGLNRNSRDLIHWARSNAHYGQDIVGVFSNDEADRGKHFEGIPILGSVQNFDEIMEKGNIDEVIVADPNLPREMVTDLMLKCENKLISFKLAADFYGLMTHYLDVEYISSVPLLGLKTLPLDDPWNRVAKRCFDLLAAFAFLVLISPFLMLVALFIRATSGSPVLYPQERVGRDGKRFVLYKFRTMPQDAEHATGPVWAAPKDIRVTEAGKILRRFNLDELPQLWNVLRGDMSLVGPRPERPHFVEKFRDEIPRYMARHKIKSGLTGWAQIHGLRGNTSLEERIKYDLYYMENWTLLMDVEILFATLFAFKNAY